MPILTADMSAGTLVAWRKKPGDAITRGDVVALVETDKGLIDIEAFTTGVLEKILVQPGTTVPTGTVLAIIDDGASAEARAPAVSPPPPAAAPAPVVAPAVPAAPGRLRISPLARKLAARLGIDPATVRGTGPGGAIRQEDIEQAAASRAAPPPQPRADVDRQARLRQAIGAAMARSKREVPHYYLSTTIDMHRTITWLTEENLRRPVPDRLLYGVC